ncbi:MAG: META domain-containing protein [Gammaproteobacteria bacterium]|nr:META domain-containing protein [Gammaproteobacteria bacterium]
MNYKLLLSGIFTLSFLLACSPQTSDTVASANPANSPAAPQVSMPLTDTVANMTYAGIHDDDVTLTDGLWEGEPFIADGASRPAVGIIDNFMLTGDLDGDGTDEVVVFLWESSGGSGTNIYLAVAGSLDGQKRNLATALVGDRVQLRSGDISDGQIELDVVQQGPGDAACCPSQLAHRYWRLGADGLTESQADITGTLLIEKLAGGEWVLVNLDINKPLPAGPRVTLIFNGGRLSGSSICNRYFASVSDGDMPGDLTVSRLGSTRMACSPADMELENSYLSALGSVTKFGFFYGKLAFSWQHEGKVQTMLFSSESE